MRQTTLLLFVIISLGAEASVTRAQQPATSTDAPRKCVAVLGAVRAPARFELKRRTRLLEVVAFAGGFAERAGQTIEITSTGVDCVRAAGANAPTSILSFGTPSSTGARVRSYQIKEINSDDEARNPYLEPGDIVVVVEVEQAFIVGHVVRPQAIALRKPVTLIEAITMAGGVTKDARTDNVTIIRNTTTSGPRLEMKFDLKKIRKHRELDPTLQPNDIIDVRSHYHHDVPILEGRSVAKSPSELPDRVIY